MNYSTKIIIDFIALFLVYIFIFFPKWKIKNKSSFFIKTLMYIYISFVLYFTLMPIITSLPFMFNHPYVSMTLEPFSDVIRNRGDFIRQIVLNIIMMVPFGILFPLTLKNKKKFLKTILAVFLFSLTIEILQPLINPYRISDITDIITNVTGGIIGYGIYLIFKLTIKIFKHKA